MILLALFLLEAIIVGGVFSSRQIEWGSVITSGYLAIDAAFLFSSVVVILGSSSLLLFPELRKRFFSGINLLLEKKGRLAAVLLAAGLICLEFIQDVLFLRSGLPAEYYYEERKLLLDKFPGFLMIFLGSLQILVSVTILKWQQVKDWIHDLFRGTKLIYFISLVLVLSLLNFSGFGFSSRDTDLAAAQTLNAPLLGVQVGLIAGVLVLVGWVGRWSSKRWVGLRSSVTAEVGIMIVIWLLTFLSWHHSPLEPNYLIDAPRAPNFELYPSSDALKYDIQALDLLNGGGMRPNSLQNNVDFIYHPLHSLYLAVLHALSGPGYQDILTLQVALLSLIPVLLYQLGSIIHSRFSGLAVSLLYLVRERNALFLGRRITVSHIKTLMTEPLALLVFMLFLYQLILWLRSDDHEPWRIIFAGGIFGALVLIRMEVLAMIPVIVLLILIKYRHNVRLGMRGIGLAGISVLIMITPWMIRNYQVEGRFGLDKSFYLRWNINRYLDFLFPEQESSTESHLSDGPDQVIVPGVLKNSAIVIGPKHDLPPVSNQAEPPTTYLLDDFVNSVQQTVYYLPISHQPLLALGSPGAIGLFSQASHQQYLEQYVNGLPYWRYSWDGKLSPRSYLPLVITVGFIAYGLSRIQRKLGWIPLLLVSLLLTQSAVYAVLSGSGGRYIFIVDWIPLLFYGIGLSGLVSAGIEQAAGPDLKGSAQKSTLASGPTSQYRKNWLSITAFGGVLLAGLVLPLSEVLLPSRYTENSLEAQISLLERNSGVDIPNPTKRREVILYGQALYPRYFEAGDRMEDDRKGTIPDYSYPRVEFYLVGTQSGWVSLPLSGEPDDFPHASEVLIVAEIQKREFSPAGEKIHGRYYQASEIYLIDPDHPGFPHYHLACSGEECDLDREE